MIGTLALSELASLSGGTLRGSDAVFSGVSTDSRAVVKGDLYVALAGERFNGHDFVESAAQKGAVAAVVSDPVETSIPVLQVKSTHQTLGTIAKFNRRQSKAKVIALTGSQGKTTVKEMTGAILSQCGTTLITSKNLNNTIGVPLTLLGLKDEEFAVIEMGANGAGEIAFSVGITEPDIVLITKASAAHIEGFGSLQGIVEAKGEILDGIDSTGTAVLNADDQNVDQWLRRVEGKRSVLFSVLEKPGSQYFASEIDLSLIGEVAFTLNSPIGNTAVRLQMMGEHNVANAISAAALALEVGASLDDVTNGLASLSPIDGRLKRLSGISDCVLIDDTYNASPDSFYSAIDALMSFPGRKIVVAGDMNELGDESKVSHESVGQYAANAGVKEFWSIGGMSAWAADAFGEAAICFKNQKELIQHCQANAAKDTVFLVKGSRGAKMENIINGLTVGETDRC